jgi:CheY-like chemotaxis protein
MPRIMSDYTSVSLLYVEDEPETREALSMVFEAKFQRVYTASNGKDGLELCEQHDPDVIISDIAMPDMDGLQLSEQVRERHPDKPIILLSAYEDSDKLKQAIEIGIDSYVSKPFRWEELDKALRKAVLRLDTLARIDAAQRELDAQKCTDAISSTLSQVTHQWKQPLTVISSHASSIEMMSYPGELDLEEVTNISKKIQEQVAFMAQTTSDFKDFIEPSKATESFFLHDLFEQVETLVKSSRHDVAIHFIAPEPPLLLNGYPNKLLHVLINILNNAIDAMNERDSRYRLIMIESQCDDKRCFIRMSDSAGGVDNGTIDTIFDAYMTTKGSRGTGLGLYMSKQFIERHMHGRLSVSNRSFAFEEREYFGASFEIIIPRDLNAQVGGDHSARDDL